jgi:predicted O-methyltransferase YrrM
MFNNIPSNITAIMRDLERRDAQDRDDGTPHLERLRQITPDTGRFIALWAASSPPGAMVEIGTSAGYSALWLAQACHLTGRTLTTFEILPEKVRLARDTFARAGVTDVVTLVDSDFLSHVDDFDEIGFCFLDAEKDVYKSCYDAVVPKLVPGGILVADNATSHFDDLEPILEFALNDERVDSMIASVGKGELVCRRRNDALGLT